MTLALANLWFHHKPKGEMHPGRAKIARKARVSIKTVTRTMAKLKQAGCLIALSHEKGGRASTRYRLRPLRLMVFCGAQLPAWVEGELAPLTTGNVPLSEAGMSRFAGDKMSHGISTVAKRSSRTSKSEVAAVSASSEVAMLDGLFPSQERKVLRPHQVEAIRLVKSSLGKGNRRVVLQGPVGFGKTLVAAGSSKGPWPRATR